MSARVLDPGVAPRQQALTLVLDVVNGQGEALAERLRARRAVVLAALGRVPTLHFGRFVVLPPPDPAGSAEGEPYRLAFESNFDGELGPHLAELGAALGPLFGEIFGACEGFASGGDARAFHEFAGRRALRARAFYAACAGLTVQMIKNDAALRRAVDRYLDGRARTDVLRRTPPRKLAAELREHVLDAVAPAQGLYVGRVRRRPRAAGGLWRMFAREPLSFALAFALAPLFELGERLFGGAAALDAPRLSRVRDELGADEDRLEQNGLTHLVPIKPGSYRRFVLELMLRAADVFGARAEGTAGQDGFESTHFARWIVLPDRRLLFLGSHDGSSEAYLDGVIERAAKAVNMIWTNTSGFPKTRLLLWRGSRHERAFKDWVRRHQLPTQIWYSAYPELSVKDVLDNARLRELLAGDIDATGARALLKVL